MRVESTLAGVAVMLLTFSARGELPTPPESQPPPTAGASRPAEGSDAETAFVRLVLPLLKSRCFVCHGEDPQGKLHGGLDLRSRETLRKGGESGSPAFVAGKPDESLLIEAIEWSGLEMPPKENDRLSKSEIAAFRDWIAAGAPWPDAKRIAELQADSWNDSKGVAVSTSGGQSEEWTRRKYAPESLWAFQPLRKPPIPAGNDSPIDTFLDQRMLQAGIAPAPPADKRTLLRRVTFDLTGLPPTSEELAEFLADHSPGAYERVVDRLLDSPHYGEQMARHWLDVVRYADTAGFSNDFERPNAWRYRDYIIKSFNDDKAYDEFLFEQLAGDEILEARTRSEPTFDHSRFAERSDSELLVATGFLRMGPWEHTGMSVMAVTRQQFLDDVVNSVCETFLATSARCFKCHDHKFDPFPARDYYRLQAVFAPMQFAERDAPFADWENTAGFDAARARIVSLIDAPGVTAVFPEAATERQRADTAKGVDKVLKKQSELRRREQYRYDPLALSVYNGPLNPKYRSNQPRHPLPGPQELTGEVQQVSLLNAGALESPGEIVTPGVLSALPGSNDQTSPSSWNTIPSTLHGRRLALAGWIASEHNPLTARVIVNRVWQWHFGTGIAAHPNNFGKTGKTPSHPELLDWLASDFIEGGWTLKRLHRQILLSRAYRRAGEPLDPERVARVDSANTLLSWFPPRRLTAEELRDAMLAVSGELNLEMHGVPVYPEINRETAFQPRHVMGSVAPAYQPSRTPAERNRRTIYAAKIRTLRDPALEVFDQPSPDQSCERRNASTVSPQVFALFNSQTSHDRALAMAVRIARESDIPETRIRNAFLRCFGREPTDEEIAACLAHVQAMTAHHAAHPPQRHDPPAFLIREMVEEMTGLTFQWREELDLLRDIIPDAKPWDVDAATRAWAELCLVLLNSNEFGYVY